MNALDFAINRDVRNKPIVREVDRAKQRELWNWVALFVLVVGAALFASWQQFQFIEHGYQLEQLGRDRAAEEERARQLRLELEVLRSPRRIEEEAIRSLRMVRPASDDVVVIERVVPSDPPPSSVLAAR